MSSTYEEYKNEYLEEIHIEAQIEGTTYDEYFLLDTLARLVNMGEIVDPQLLPVYKKGRNNRIMAFDALAFDESDKSVVLIASEFKDSINGNLTMSDITKAQTRMINFLEEAYEGTLDKYFDIYDDVLKIGRNIARRMHVDYVVTENDDSIDKIKLIIITNQDISNSVKDLPSFLFMDKKVTVSIWSTLRFFELYQSGREREPIVIKTEKYGVNGIPVIKADMAENIDYDAYLAIVPGEFLHKIYYEHGSHLLEGNVRAFLSNRGKINQGIRNTIRKEPTKFFTYNNGIACTAKKIILSQDGHYIKEIEDLQIINGGQTTASLTSAVLKDKMSLDNIYVPMKLTVVKNDNYDAMIQNISKYANSQNKVTDADFFSNHPFHRLMEEMSVKVPAPAKDGSLHGTYWYYERSRGKYEQTQFKLTKKSEIDKFKARYPKNQVVKKEELAKYYTAMELLRPDRVSAGAQKVMKFFAEKIEAIYQTKKEMLNQEFFKRCIAYTIIYRETDRIVNKAEWYNVGGYKLNIVPYTISKLISLIPHGYSLDYERIWKKQELYPSLASELNNLAQVTNTFIQQSSRVIVTEFCKKEDTWKKYRNEEYQFSNAFIDDLVSSDLAQERITAESREEKLAQNLNIEYEIINLGGDYWKNLIEEGNKRKLLSPMELDLLNIAASSDSAQPKVASPKQAKQIWKIRKKLEEGGVLV